MSSASKFEKKRVRWSLDEKAIEPIVSGRSPNWTRGSNMSSNYYFKQSSNYHSYWGNGFEGKANTYERVSLPYRPVFNPEFRQPVTTMNNNNNNGFRPYPAYGGRGYPVSINQSYYHNGFYHDNYSYRPWDPMLASAQYFPNNQQEPFSQIHQMNSYSRGNSHIVPTRPYILKSEVVEKKVFNLVKTVSDDKWRFDFNALAPSNTQPLNMFSSRNNASSAVDNISKCASAAEKIRKLVQNVSDSKFGSHSKISTASKAQNAKTFSASDKNGQEKDRKVPESDYSPEEDDDLIFLGIVDKNDLKKDVEVITISDDEEDGVEGDENKEFGKVKLEGAGSNGEDYKNRPKFRYVEPTRRVILTKENFHFFK